MTAAPSQHAAPPSFTRATCIGDPGRCYDIDCACCLSCIRQRDPHLCNCPLWAAGFRVLGPDLWYGLSGFTDEAEYCARLEARWRLEDQHGHAMMPGFGSADLRESRELLDKRDARRLPVILSYLYDQHPDRHWFFTHPYCPGCYPQEVASARLVRWLLLNPGRTPRDTWDRSIPRPPVEMPGAVAPFFTLSELRGLPPAEWLVDGLVPQGSLGYITGRDGVYKTFLALDLCLHLITGSAWNGRPLSFGGYGRAVYVAGEGVRSFATRIDAWVQHHEVRHELRERTGLNVHTGAPTYSATGEEREGLDPLLQEPNLIIRNGAVDLYAGADAFAALLGKVRDVQPDLLVIDTLARSAGAAEQNSASDMSVITARIGELKAAAGDHCTVLVIAHTDKGDNDARGSSSIEDDSDFVLHLAKIASDRVRVEVAKMKDGESGQHLELLARPFGGSLVLVAPPAALGTALSDSLAARIKAVLFAVRGLDQPTAKELLALVQADGTGKPASRTEVYRVLGDLERHGAVVGEKANSRPTTPTRYRLDRSQYPPDVSE